jgi:predicted amidohydrolase YtcJ
MRSLTLVALALVVLDTSSTAQPQVASSSCSNMKNVSDQFRALPDVIFVNGDIYTQATPTRAQATAVSDGCIVAVGSNDDIRKLKGPRTQVVDLGGHFVMPGFNDAHVHLEEAGLEALSVDLRGTGSLPEMEHLIVSAARAASPGEWLVGGGWDQTKWTDQKLPSRRDLDVYTFDHPAVFVRVDGHISVANTAALKAGGVTAQTQAPPGGSIDHDANGEPTGILRETARALVESKVPPPSPARLRQAAELALADAARWGITSVQDNSSWDIFLIYEQMEREGKLTLRISEWLNFNDPVDVLKSHRAHHPANDPMLHTAMLKGFMDGSLGSRTAALLAPYSDDPGNSGLARYEQEKLNRMAVERAAAGFQIGFHAIGDRAAQIALDAFAASEAANPQAHNLRFRIEHDQVITPAQFAQYRKMGVIASMQPSHLLTDMNWAMARLGPERAKMSYAWKEFLDNGVPLAFGTDYPVEPITPFRGIYAAVTRMNEAGTKSYFPEQKLTIEQALAAYTTGSAYAQFAEKEKGTLAPGMLADFVVLDRDLTKVAPAEILKTRVLRTVVGGKTVYEAAR